MEVKTKIGNSWGVGSGGVWNGNSRGVEGFKLKNHPWGGGYGHFLESHISVLNYISFNILKYIICQSGSERHAHCN